MIKEKNFSNKSKKDYEEISQALKEMLRSVHGKFDVYVTIKERPEKSSDDEKYSEKIVSRFYDNYNLKYNLRKLTDYLKKTMEVLSESYNEKTGENINFLDYFKIDSENKIRRNYHFEKGPNGLYDLNNYPVTLTEDEKLDEICSMFKLCFDFNDRKQWTSKGFEMMGLLVDRWNEGVLLGEKVETVGAKFRRSIKIYLSGELTVEEVIAQVNEILKMVKSGKAEDANFVTSEKDKAVAQKTIETSLYQFLNKFSLKVIEELEILKIYAICIEELDEYKIRQYTKGGRDKKNECIKLNEKKFEKKFLEQLYCAAVESVTVDDQANNVTWEKHIRDIFEYLNEKDVPLPEEGKLTLEERQWFREKFIYDFLDWRYQQYDFLQRFMKARLLERIRYLKKKENGKISSIQIRKRDGKFFLPSEEAEFWQNAEKKSSERVMEQIIGHKKISYYSTFLV